MSDLDVQLLISTSTGTLDLSAPPYDLESGTIAEKAVTWRKKSVENPHVEGSYTLHAERENTVVPVNVWVEHPNRSVQDRAVRALEAALSQLQYTIICRIGTVTETWVCEVADYTTDTQQAFLSSTTTLIRAQVPRRPQVQVSYA